jgi:hypothetical protein
VFWAVAEAGGPANGEDEVVSVEDEKTCLIVSAALSVDSGHADDD